MENLSQTPTKAHALSHQVQLGSCNFFLSQPLQPLHTQNPTAPHRNNPPSSKLTQKEIKLH
jgi:hypothetical protein